MTLRGQRDEKESEKRLKEDRVVAIALSEKIHAEFEDMRRRHESFQFDRPDEMARETLVFNERFKALNKVLEFGGKSSAGVRDTNAHLAMLYKMLGSTS